MVPVRSFELSSRSSRVEIRARSRGTVPVSRLSATARKSTMKKYIVSRKWVDKISVTMRLLICDTRIAGHETYQDRSNQTNSRVVYP